MMPKLSRRAGKLVGLSNALNRPTVDGVDDIYAEIFASIVDQRLPPGTKLNELTLCEIFNVGRRQIGQVLQRLSYDSLIMLHPNRGAFVAMPAADEPPGTFDARPVIAPETTRLVPPQPTLQAPAPLTPT